jgi:hypothetical protein
MVLLTLSIQIQNESDQIHETLDKTRKMRDKIKLYSIVF